MIEAPRWEEAKVYVTLSVPDTLIRDCSHESLRSLLLSLLPALAMRNAGRRGSGCEIKVDHGRIGREACYPPSLTL